MISHLEQERVKEGRSSERKVMLVVVLRRQMDREDGVGANVNRDVKVCSVERTKNVEDKWLEMM